MGFINNLTREIKEYDKFNMLDVIRKFPRQIIEAYNLARGLVVKPGNNILFCGMGGSGICGEIASLLSTKPSYALHDYKIPSWVDNQTNVFISSYSGNTEETISCFKQSMSKTKEVVVITSNGRLEKLAKSYRKLLISIPKGLQPRNSIAYLTIPMLRIMQNSNLGRNITDDLKKGLSTLKHIEKKALDILKNFEEDATPIIYGTQELSVIAYRWRTQFNENCKIIALSHALPEANHNEIEAFENIKFKAHLFLLSSKTDPVRIRKRVSLTKRYAKRSGLRVTHIELGGGLLSRMILAIHLGDFITYYHALRLKVDPTPVNVIERFKKDMGFSL